jgi:hypothetical protein
MLQVGLMVATLQLDASLLIQAFDLGFCDAFMAAEVFEECETAAKHAAAEKVRNRHDGLSQQQHSCTAGACDELAGQQRTHPYALGLTCPTYFVGVHTCCLGMQWPPRAACGRRMCTEGLTLHVTC